MKLIYTLTFFSFLSHLIHYKIKCRKFPFLWFWNTPALLPENRDLGQLSKLYLAQLAWLCTPTSEVNGGHLINNDRYRQPKECNELKQPEPQPCSGLPMWVLFQLLTQKYKREKNNNKIEDVSFKIYPQKNPHFCFPNTSYLHKLCHSIGLIMGSEDKREQGRTLHF